MSTIPPPPTSSSPPPPPPSSSSPKTDDATPRTDPPSDPTFRFYTPHQAATYATQRKGYAGPLLEHVLALHTSRGGGWGTVLDVGTGTGQVVRDVAPLFATAVGVDPGVEMIAQATDALGGATTTTTTTTTTRTGQGIVFLVAGAEEIDMLGEDVPHGSVDLITAGMAAHWFDMPKFWAAAAQVLKPGGSVALWTKSSYYCHPTSTPNAAQVQAVLSEFEDITLGPYALPQNKLSQHNYRALALPWAVPETAPLFDPSTLQRHEWDVGGRLTDGTDFFGGAADTTLAALRQGMGTASMVTRWREAHPALVGTERDCVQVLVEKLRGALGAVGTEREEDVSFRAGMGTGLLFLNRAK